MSEKLSLEDGIILALGLSPDKKLTRDELETYMTYLQANGISIDHKFEIGESEYE